MKTMRSLIVLFIAFNNASANDYPVCNYFPNIKEQDYTYIEARYESVEFIKLGFIKESEIIVEDPEDPNIIVPSNYAINKLIIHNNKLKYIEINKTSNLFINTSSERFNKYDYKLNDDLLRFYFPRQRIKAKNVISYCVPATDNCKKYIYGDTTYTQVLTYSDNVILINYGADVVQLTGTSGNFILGFEFWGEFRTNQLGYNDCSTIEVGKVRASGIQYDNCKVITCRGWNSFRNDTFCNDVGIIKSLSSTDTGYSNIQLLTTEKK